MSEQQYLDSLRSVLTRGIHSQDRTGTGTIRLFGMQMRFDLSEGFPLLTTKRLFTKAIFGELLWFLEGSTNRNRLERITFGTRGQRSTIWDEWADENGELGPIYGAQWRRWGGDPWFSLSGGHDQLHALVKQIRETPDSRRLVVSAWNVDQLRFMALPPCHTLWQVSVLGGKLSLQLYQRSGDMFLGVPFNIASYALLTHMLAQVTGYEPGEFILTIGDAHIYSNHIEQVTEQLTRTPSAPPKLILNPFVEELTTFTMDDIRIEDYHPQAPIYGDVAV